MKTKARKPRPRYLSRTRDVSTCAINDSADSCHVWTCATQPFSLPLALAAASPSLDGRGREWPVSGCEILRIGRSAEVSNGFHGGVQEKVKRGLFRTVNDYSIQYIA